MRPKVVVVLTGTGTEVGKTWLTAQLTTILRGGGRSVAVRKPAQSFEAGARTDAEMLGEASGEDPLRVCPEHRWYPVAMAPPMAAAALGKPPPTLAELIDETMAGWPDPPVDVGFVETAGGVASPQAVDGDSSDLARGLGADVAVVVADSGLGAINDVRLSTRALHPVLASVFMNRFRPDDQLHLRNRDWLSEVDGLTVRTDPAGLATWLTEAAGEA